MDGDAFDRRIPKPGWYLEAQPGAEAESDTLFWWDGAAWAAWSRSVDGGWAPPEPFTPPQTPPPTHRGLTTKRTALLVGVLASIAALLALVAAVVVVVIAFRDSIDESFDGLTTGAAGVMERSCARDLEELRTAAEAYREQNGESTTERELVVSNWIEKESPYFDITVTGRIVTEDGSPCDEP